VHTRLGSFLPPAPTSSLTTQSATSLSPPPQYPAAVAFLKELLTMVITIEEIKKNSLLLQNLSLGFDIYNVPHTEWKTLENSFIWLSGPDKVFPNYTCREMGKSIAALTGSSWAISAQIGTLLEL
jgi:hypothetical protein